MAGGAAILPSCCDSNKPTSAQYADYSKLDEALAKPILKRELFSSPVIIESVELLLLKSILISLLTRKTWTVCLLT